jgi:uncharacterized protein YneF (UPF0154 family)
MSTWSSPSAIRTACARCTVVSAVHRVAIVLGLVLGAFFIVRAVVELLTIDYSDPSSYADDWGGPSLAGVLLVHCGLGLISGIAIGIFAWRRVHAERTTDT